MSTTRFLDQNNVEGFLSFLSQQAGRVLSPIEKPSASKTSIVFEPWQKGNAPTLAKATVPPKEAVFPECETLLTFHVGRGEQGLPNLELNVSEHAVPTIVFACRPCDAMGFTALDRPYMDGLFKDPYYKARREVLTVVTLACAKGCETCFCHWTGGSPVSTEGSDVLMTKIEGGFLLEAVTPRGEELLARSNLPDGADKLEEGKAAHEKALQSLKPAPDITNSPAKLKAIFSDMDFWTKQTARCISCGACTYFCPTCYCFNITDEGEAQSERGGRRLRSWDNCMSSRYTREASGHNPRPLKSQRMRNRVSHKFWTYPENWGAYLCSGCGRCITNCPVNLDIRAIVLAALAHNG